MMSRWGQLKGGDTVGRWGEGAGWLAVPGRSHLTEISYICVLLTVLVIPCCSFITSVDNNSAIMSDSFLTSLC